MAIKTFTSGAVLTSADTNTYLNNGGLVYITTATASGTAPGVNIQSCFSATYDNYRIEIINGRSSSAANISFQMLTGATPVGGVGYACGYTGLSSLGASTNVSNNNQAAGFMFESFLSSEGGNTASFDIMNPFRATRTSLIGGAVCLNSGLNGFNFRSGVSHHEVQLSYDGIRIIASAGNITFTARIYGYRQA